MGDFRWEISKAGLLLILALKMKSPEIGNFLSQTLKSKYHGFESCQVLLYRLCQTLSSVSVSLNRSLEEVHHDRLSIIKRCLAMQLEASQG